MISLARTPRNHEVGNPFPNEKITASWDWTTQEQRYALTEKFWPLKGCWVYYDVEEETRIKLSNKSFSSSSDTDGDGISDEQKLKMGQDPHSYNITLAPGWNLVSLCRVPADHSVEAIFGNATHPQAWTWKNGQYKSKEVLKPLRGCWVYAVTWQEVDISVSLP